MASDAVLPNFFTKVNSKGSYPRIVVSFFILCTSILLVTGGDLLALAGVYTIAFLTVMSLFALGNLILRETRSELKRTYHAPLIFVVLALCATVLGIIGNIDLNPRNLDYFATYFIPAVILVFAFGNIDSILGFSLRFAHNIPFFEGFVHKNVDNFHEGQFIAFVHHIDRVYPILEYFNKNEVAWHITLIHSACNEHTNDVGKGARELRQTVDTLQKAGVFPHLKVDVAFVNEPFSPELVEKVSKEYHIGKNKILIGSIHHEHPYDYDQFGGVRIIF